MSLRLCLKNYGLDPAHFYTAPGLAWKARLKKTKIRLESLFDPDMLLMFERGISGGITQLVHRWAKVWWPIVITANLRIKHDIFQWK